MQIIRVGYRLVLLGLVVLSGFILAVLFLRGTMPPKGIQSTITRWWHRNVANSLGIAIYVYGTPREEATLFVSNHVSSFDITALGSVVPVCFLSKAEVRSWPLLGWLATRAGTLYITRGGNRAANNANTEMADALSMKQNIMLFAEGTVTDGTIIRFHSRLLQSAVDSGSHIQPVAIRYPHPKGNKVHPAVLILEDMSFLDLARRLLTAKNLKVEIFFGEPMSAVDKNRDELARYAEAEVRRLLES